MEGLRALCSMKSITQDTFPSIMKTDIPPPLQYPIKPQSFKFVTGLVMMFYAPGEFVCVNPGESVTWNRG